MIVDDKIRALREFEATVNAQIRMAIATRETEIANLNAQVQLFEMGVDSSGREIASYLPYRPLTVQIKQSKGQPTNRVTLRDTGDFHASFFVIAEDDEFYIVADDWKIAEIEYKYGRQIFGLTPLHMAKVAHEYLYPELLNNLRQALL